MKRNHIMYGSEITTCVSLEGKKALNKIYQETERKAKSVCSEK